MLNEGISFGLFPGISVWILIAVLALLLLYAVKMRELWRRVGLGLIIAGGAMNIWSRIRHGGVVDNLNLMGFLANNVADYLIFFGLMIYIAGYLRTIRTLSKPDNQTF